MGWTSFRADDKKSFIKDILKENSSHKLLGKSVNGSEMWTAWENPEGKRYICLFLLSTKDGIWSYKDMTEDMHPYFYACPFKFLDMVPVMNEKWREGVRKHHEEKRNRVQMLKSLDIGKIVKLKRSIPNTFKVYCLKPLLGIDPSTGVSYRLPKSRIVEVQ